MACEALLQLKNAYSHPLVRRSILACKLGQTNLAFNLRSAFISRSARARLQVSVCIGYDLCHSGWHPDAHRQHLTRLYEKLSLLSLKITVHTILRYSCDFNIPGKFRVLSWKFRSPASVWSLFRLLLGHGIQELNLILSSLFIFFRFGINYWTKFFYRKTTLNLHSSSMPFAAQTDNQDSFCPQRLLLFWTFCLEFSEQLQCR